MAELTEDHLGDKKVEPCCRPKKIMIPRRKPSLVVPEKVPIFIAPDKTTCVECTCFPKEDAYVKNKKLDPCQVSPQSLYELASLVVDKLNYPAAFSWSVDDVARWMAEDVGFLQFKDCVLANDINGRRLIALEDPSNLAKLNIRDFECMKRITSKVRQLYGIEMVRFARSLTLPSRKPLTHCTWFKSRTGPSWGIRENWSRCDILRRMQIIEPEPDKIDHWDLVWYQKPDFPKVKFARTGKRPISDVAPIPQYVPRFDDKRREYLTPRRFRIQENISESKQYIWMEYAPPPVREERVPRRTVKTPRESRLVPKKVDLKGLTGKAFVLAKRKFLPPTKKN